MVVCMGIVLLVVIVIFGMGKVVAECLFQWWLGKDILPSSWPMFMAYLDNHVPQRVIKIVRWFLPIGWCSQGKSLSF